MLFYGASCQGNAVPASVRSPVVPAAAAPAPSSMGDGRFLLSVQDTEELALWVKLMNQFQQPPGFEEAQTAVLDLLRLRSTAAGAAKFRKVGKCTKAGLRALQKGAISRDWYVQFRNERPDLKCGYASDMDPKRGQWPTLGVMEKHNRLCDANAASFWATNVGARKNNL